MRDFLSLMAYTALAANIDADSFRKRMVANRWWLTMAQCGDGTFYYQSNRDNAGYDSESHKTAPCVVAFILVITGKEAKQTTLP